MAVGKSAKRRFKKARLVAIYREFFSNPMNWDRIRALKLEWLVDLHPRLVRDTVLGTPV